MEEKKTNMKDMKIISFALDDYKKFFGSLKEDKYAYIICFILGITSYFVMSITKETNNTIYVIAFWSLLLFGGGFVIVIFSTYWNSINDINIGAWGVSIAPVISYIFCYKFFVEVSFDKTFVIGASIILSWIFTKFILSISKDMKK